MRKVRFWRNKCLWNLILTSCNEQQKQEIVDEVNTRRTSTRNAKFHAKNGGDTKIQSTRSLASTMGKKRNTNKC